MQVGGRMVAIILRGILPFGTGPSQRGGFRRDGRGYTRMERAILLIPCHLAACIARERDRLTVHGGEQIDPRGTQLILGFIHNGKEAPASMTRTAESTARRKGCPYARYSPNLSPHLSCVEREFEEPPSSLQATDENISNLGIEP